MVTPNNMQVPRDFLQEAANALPRQRKRLRETLSKLAGEDKFHLALVNEIDATLCSFLQDVFAFLLSMRGYMGETNIGFASEMEALRMSVESLAESVNEDHGGSGLEEEELTDLVKLCGAAQALVELLRQPDKLPRALDATMKAMLDETEQLVTRCMGVLESFGDEGDEDDGEPAEDDSDDDDGEPATDQPEGAAGG